MCKLYAFYSFSMSFFLLFLWVFQCLITTSPLYILCTKSAVPCRSPVHHNKVFPEKAPRSCLGWKLEPHSTPDSNTSVLASKQGKGGNPNPPQHTHTFYQPQRPNQLDQWRTMAVATGPAGMRTVFTRSRCVSVPFRRWEQSLPLSVTRRPDAFHAHYHTRDETAATQLSVLKIWRSSCLELEKMWATLVGSRFYFMCLNLVLIRVSHQQITIKTLQMTS